MMTQTLNEMAARYFEMTKAYPPMNRPFRLELSAHLDINGAISWGVGDSSSRWPEAERAMAAWVAEFALKLTEEAEKDEARARRMRAAIAGERT